MTTTTHIMLADGLSHLSTGSSAACPTCNPDHESPTLFAHDHPDEARFSSFPCELCRSPLGGNRYVAHAHFADDPTGPLIHLAICLDCLETINGIPLV